MSIASFNQRWAEVILETLSRHQVRHICIAPGSRSTPLTLAAARHRAFQHHTHFDERGLGHLALGLAKASDSPVALIVTSGTALANLYPAVIEARLTGEKLILLTADRPPELIHCGASQAIDQQGIYASHVTGAVNLPCPSQQIPARWLVSTLDSLLAQQHSGAVQINCPFAEPLYGGETETDCGWQQALTDWWHSDTPWLCEQYTHSLSLQPDWPYWRQQKGVILAGRISPQDGLQLAKWAQQLGWPLIGDLLSQTGQPLPCADLWLNHPRAQALLAQAAIVLQFGGSLTSKRLLNWQASCQPQEYWLIDKLSGRLNPAQHRGRRLIAPVTDWLKLHPAISCHPWAAELTTLAQQTQQLVAQHSSELSETVLAHRLVELLPPDGQLFIGNSLVIRLADALGQLPPGYPVYANRGASGIDGLIATAAGAQRASRRPALTLLGDLSALYDINSLALLRDTAAPHLLIVVNNNGGQIFSLLNTPDALRQQFYCMPHGLDFQHAAALFHLNYQRPHTWQQLKAAISQGFSASPPATTLVEINLPSQQGVKHFKQLLEQAGQL